jgi:hypothetical protein
MEKKLVADRFYSNVVIVIAVPWIVIAYFLTVNGFGYRRGFYPFCSAGKQVGIIGALIFFVPLTIVTLVGLYLLLSVIFKTFLVFHQSSLRAHKAMTSVFPAVVPSAPNLLAASNSAGQQRSSFDPHGDMQNDAFFFNNNYHGGAGQTANASQLAASNAALARVVWLSLDMIIFNFVLVIWDLDVTITTIMSDFVLKEAAANSYDTWTKCIFTMFNTKVVEDSVWQAKCGTVPNFYNPLSTIRFAVFAQVSNALMMALIYLPRRLLRWFQGPKEKTVIRRRWLIPDTQRIMKRESLVQWMFGSVNNASPAVGAAAVPVVAQQGNVPNPQRHSQHSGGGGVAATSAGSGLGRPQGTIDSMPILHYVHAGAGASSHSSQKHAAAMMSSVGEESKSGLHPHQ